MGSFTSLLVRVGVSSSLCLSAVSNHDGAHVVLAGCMPGQADQLWTSDTSFRIFGDKCLDITDGVFKNGTPLQIWTCSDGNSNQSFDLQDDQIVGSSNLCADVPSGNFVAGQRVQVWECSFQNVNQNFAVKGHEGFSIVTDRGMNCMSVTFNGDNAAVVAETCSRSASQRFRLGADGTVAVFEDQCLTVPSGNTANGVKLHTQKCNPGNANQNFFFTDDSRIGWTNHGECLDLTDGNMKVGTPIQLWKCTDNDNNQVFDITSN